MINGCHSDTTNIWADRMERGNERERERAQHKLAKMVVIIAINRYVTDTTPSSDSKKD